MKPIELYWIRCKNRWIFGRNLVDFRRKTGKLFGNKIILYPAENPADSRGQSGGQRRSSGRYSVDIRQTSEELQADQTGRQGFWIWERLEFRLSFFYQNYEENHYDMSRSLGLLSIQKSLKVRALDC